MASYDFDEKAALLEAGHANLTYGSLATLNSTIKVEPLRYSDIPQAVHNTYRASRVESLSHYFTDADTGPFPASRQNVLMSWTCADRVRHNRSFTINHGDSILLYRERGEGRAAAPPRWILSLINLCKTAELRKREEEVGAKLRAMLKSALGDRIGSMMELHGLATAPAKQGRGYATALVKTLNDLADARDCAVWVFTDDAQWFYEELGYVLVAEDWAGVDNPTWKGEPVPLRVMLREPESAGGFVDVEKGLTDATRRFFNPLSDQDCT